jgi:hypothetical protein
MSYAEKRTAALLLVELVLAMPTLGQQRSGVSENVEASRSVTLNAKYCRPSTAEQKKWVGADWAPFESYEIACPLRYQGRVVLYVLSVNDYDIEDALPASAPAPTLPKAVIVTVQGRSLGSLPLAFPFDAPLSLHVSFSKWNNGMPRTVKLFLEDPTVVGNKNLPPLNWDEKRAQYIETETSNGK